MRALPSLSSVWTSEETTYLVESYVAGLDEAASSAIAVRLRAAVSELQRQGVAVRWLGSLALHGEETYLCVLAAADSAAVAVVNARAGLTGGHVVEVAVIEPAATEARR